MKKLSEMNNKELFCTLTGSSGVVLQAQLQDIVADYRKQCKAQGIPADKTLEEIVSMYQAEPKEAE